MTEPKKSGPVHDPETNGHATVDPRCFTPFLDPIDGVVALSATATARDVEELAAAHQLRFPLMIDSHATLREQVESTSYAPASSRFGPFCDNIVGMNWKLPNGHIVRIGERVVKTCTGYDLFRFLLGSGNRFGEPVDYVLRLRPNCGTTNVYHLSGDSAAVSAAVPQILKNCWMHWFDAIDLLAESGDCKLRITVNCPVPERPLVEAWLTKLAATQQLVLQADRDVTAPTDGCPDFVFKTTPEAVVALARDIARTDGIRCVALCYNGVVLGYVSEDRRVDRIQALVNAKRDELQAVGGDWHSRHLPAAVPSAVEASWVSILEQESHFT